MKGLYDYDLVKNCCVCKKTFLKRNFHKNKTKNDGFHPQCKICRKENYVDNKNRLLNKQKFYINENRDQLLEYQKKYYLDNRDKIIEYRKRYKKKQSQDNFL